MVASPSSPNPPYGSRLLITEFDRRARDESDHPWVSIPVDDDEVSKGYRDVSYGQLASGVNTAVAWLLAHLPASPGSFASFAYVGTRDLRYPFFAIAAGKLSLVMICPSSTVTAEAQKRIMEQKQCTIFLHDSSVKARALELQHHDPNIRTVQAPDLSELPFSHTAVPYPYKKSWAEAKDDPWLVFHTSGTTGHPKVITYSQSQFGACDMIRGLPDIRETNSHHYVDVRWLSPLPLLHFSGMHMVLPTAVFCNTVSVLCPASQPPSPSVVKQILKATEFAGANLTPALLDTLCADPEALSLLRKLSKIHYVGASLSVATGNLLSPKVCLAPAIGSTDAGGYFIEIVNKYSDWDNISFQPSAGAVLEPRLDDMHELVFIKNPKCVYQPLFYSRPGVSRFETKDLWIEHPIRKGQWKIAGRTDDYIAVAGGGGLYVAPLEPILQEHPQVKTALVGGQAKPKPVILLDLIPSARAEVAGLDGRAAFIESLRPFVNKANERCHESVKLDPSLVIFTTTDKPLVRTAKDTVSRAAAMQLYKDEIEAIYQQDT